ncbi:inner-membrane translocator [marine sediment metagenome]|uniref:Inner-membrane translocator n=1 Tax=marine sediment metagenome TaxID=412755 RepID=A0A1B6NR61_9ZZZZ
MAVSPLPLIAALTGDPYLVVVATRILAFAMAALALDLILGYGGMVSFGHAAYLGIGAYAVAILSRAGITDLGAHLGAAVVAGAAFALVTGAISLRTRGIYFIMITLAFAQMAYFFFVSLSAYGGDDGVTLTARSTVLGRDWLADDRVLYYAALAMLAGALSAVRGDHRVAVRAGADRRAGKPAADAGGGLHPVSVPADGLRHLRGHDGHRRGDPGQSGQLRLALLHELAPLGGVGGDGRPGRHRQPAGRHRGGDTGAAAGGVAGALYRTLAADLRRAPDPGRAVLARRA